VSTKNKKVKVKQFLPYGQNQGQSTPTLFNPGSELPGLFGPSQANSTPSNSFGSMFSRLGGIDGILGMMGKVQKMVGMFRQFSPMLKMFMTPKAQTSSLPRGTKRKKKRKIQKSQRDCE
jgi:hypothetical protein